MWVQINGCCCCCCNNPCRVFTVVSVSALRRSAVMLHVSVPCALPLFMSPSALLSPPLLPLLCAVIYYVCLIHLSSKPHEQACLESPWSALDIWLWPIAFLLSSLPFLLPFAFHCTISCCVMHSFHLTLLCSVLSFMCDAVYPVSLAFPKTPLQLLVFFSLLISAPCSSAFPTLHHLSS